MDFSHEIYKQKFDTETNTESIKKDVLAYGDVSVGTDVEVLWMSKVETYRGKSGFSFFNADRLFIKNGLFGTDGRSLQGEWRITPAYDIALLDKLTKNMMEMCKTFLVIRQDKDASVPVLYPYGMGVYNIISERDLRLPESIGLHIHLGNKNLVKEKNQKILTAALDLLLLPVIKLFENKTAHHIRTNCGLYGTTSDFKNKPYGYEYKSLPSCIDDRHVYLATFAIAKAIAFEVIAGTINLKTFENMFLDLNKIRNFSYLRRKARESKLIVKRNCRFYLPYKTMIDTLYDMAINTKYPHEFFDTQEDIFSSWGVDYDLESRGYRALCKGSILMPQEAPVKGYSTVDYLGSPSRTEDSFEIITDW